MLRLLALLPLTLVLSGCLLSRPGALAPRYLDVALPVVGPERTEILATVRLDLVSGAEHLRQPVVIAEGGELRPDSQWLWAAMLHRSLDRALRLAAAPAGIALVDRPGEATARVRLTAFHLHSVAGGQATLEAQVLLAITAADGRVHHHRLSDERPVTLPLPGDLPTVAGDLIDALAHAIWKQVAAGNGS
jgi:hypothetical protein